MSIKPAKPSAQPITPWSSSRPTTKKKLPDAFLRRCFFHFIRFPSPEGLAAIVRLHFPHLKEDLLAAALTQFFDIREAPGLKKKPSTSEVLDWLKLLLADDLTSADL